MFCIYFIVRQVFAGCWILFVKMWTFRVQGDCFYVFPEEDYCQTMSEILWVVYKNDSGSFVNTNNIKALV